MTNNTKVCQFFKLEWEPVPWNFEVGSYLAGNELPNNSLGNVRGISLCPLYSDKQLRKIYRRKLEKANIEYRNSDRDTVKTAIKDKSVQEVMYR